MLMIRHIIFLLFLFISLSVFRPALSLWANQSYDNQLPFENTATINQLRFCSKIRYTRIIIDLDNEVPFNFNLKKIQSPTKTTFRVIIDIQNSKLSERANRIVKINDELVTNAKLEQYISSSVRVLIDIKKLKEYKIFSLSNPFRIVIDFWGKASKASNLTTKKDITKGALINKLELGVKRICIDPGFGGREKGAPGCEKDVFSKDVNLELSKMLAKKIRETLNLEVIMTRETDDYLTLEERTAIANTKNADLFISIHTNAADDQTANGIETYYLNLATDDETIFAAARENATSSKDINDLHAVLSDLIQNAKLNESARLADQVQESLYDHMKKKYSNIKNRGIKSAPFYVLLGAQMPAVLVATSFISNPKECKRLLSEEYQNDICEGIVEGIKNYIAERNYKVK